jgi:nicotinamidase-related amidase
MDDTAWVGWVVDAQVDFMDPDGRLYVKDLEDPDDVGSVQVVPELRRAVAWMREKCRVVVFTGDWHGLEDAEIDPDNPDPGTGTYPPHCMGRSPDPEERAGAEIIPEIRPVAPLVLEIGATEQEARKLAAQAVEEDRPVFIHKNRFNVFEGNEATEAFLAGLGERLARPLEFWVAGVSRDVCVTEAVDGLLRRDFAVTALSDATWGLGLEPEAETLARWSRGGRVITTAQLPG